MSIKSVIFTDPRRWGIGAQRIDVDARQIIGFAVATKGPAAGHGECLDDESLRQIVEMGNATAAAAATGAIRARMDHPMGANPSSIECPLDKLLGYPTNFRLDGDVVRADLKLLSAAASPASSQLLALASEAPELLGASLVFDVSNPKEHVKARKAGKNPPVRFKAIYAVDFVDLPATNPNGLFSAGTKDNEQEEEAMAKGKLSAYVRNGGLFANVGGDEYEIDMPDEYGGKKMSRKADDEDGEGEQEAAKKHSMTRAELQTERDNAVQAERVYRSQFYSAMTSGGITGKDAEAFEKDFYGRPIEDVKFLAASRIGVRAKGVGEGTGDQEETDAQKAKKKAVAEDATATDRWSAESGLRGMFGCHTDNKDDESYKAGLARFLLQNRRYEADRRAEAARRHGAQSGSEQA